MKKYILLAFLSLTLALTACKSDEPSQQEPVEESSDDTVVEEPSVEPVTIIPFVDAHGGYHEMVFNPDAAVHNYNWDYLKNDKSGIFYEGDENYTIRKGVDVSYYQGDINWKKVKADGYDFAIIRLGFRGYGEEGTLNLDKTYHQNMKGAIKAGLDVGVYFFAQAINEEEAWEEAKFVLDALEGYHLTMPVVYDPETIESDEARTDTVSGKQFTKNAAMFCRTIEDAGYDAMIYSNLIWESEKFDMGKLKNYPFWYADYEKIPQTPYDFVMWQYTSSGKVDGIEGRVDLNIEFIPTK